MDTTNLLSPLTIFQMVGGKICHRIDRFEGNSHHICFEVQSRESRECKVQSRKIVNGVSSCLAYHAQSNDLVKKRTER